MPSKLWDDFNYPFPNFNGVAVEVWEWMNISSHTFNECNYLSMLGFQLKHVSKSTYNINALYNAGVCRPASKKCKNKLYAKLE